FCLGAAGCGSARNRRCAAVPFLTLLQKRASRSVRCAICRNEATLLIYRCEIFLLGICAWAHNERAFIRSTIVEQGQGDSSSPIPYSMSFAGSQREDREPAGAKQEAK